MISRLKRSLLLAVFLSLLMVTQASAGGWAVITLDELPVDVVAGEPLTIGFTVRQHGRTPMAGLHPTVTANRAGAQELVVNAEAEGRDGHYVATLNFPEPGEWQWSIQAFSMDQTMPTLNVTASTANGATSTVPKAEPSFSELSPLTWGSIALLAVGLVGTIISVRSRNRQVAGLTAVSLLAAVTLFIVGAGRASAEEVRSDSVSASALPASISPVEYGRQLFIAKGCITCHQNSRAASPSEYWTIESGAPDLSHFSADPEVIFMRLKDPSSVKSDTRMPNLELKEFEIEALVAFINSK